MTIDDSKIETQFLRALERAGIEPCDELRPEMDGKIHRFAVEGDRGGEVSGAYCIHTDGTPAGYFQDWRKGIKENWKYYFSDDERREYGRENNSITPEEREQQRRETEARKAEEKKRQEENQQRATAAAWKEYEQAHDVSSHPYLIKKHINNSGIWFRNNSSIGVPRENSKGHLLFPLVDATTRKFKTLQRIYLDENGIFQKKFFYHGDAYAACLELIPYFCEQSFKGIFEADEILICEGAATGFSLLEITEKNVPVICAMSAGQILPVAKAWRERLPRVTITIAADNDEVGIKKANETIAAGYADRETHPPKINKVSDWNDYINYMKGVL